jgi:hypothetical protein
MWMSRSKQGKNIILHNLFWSGHTVPVDSTNGLGVVTRIPRGIKDYDAVSTDQIDA